MNVPINFKLMLALLITLFSTAQLGCTAILGAYVGRILTQVKGRPLFVISEQVASPFRFGLAPPVAGEAHTGRR